MNYLFFNNQSKRPLTISVASDSIVNYIEIEGNDFLKNQEYKSDFIKKVKEGEIIAGFPLYNAFSGWFPNSMKPVVETEIIAINREGDFFRGILKPEGIQPISLDKKMEAKLEKHLFEWDVVYAWSYRAYRDRKDLRFKLVNPKNMASFTLESLEMASGHGFPVKLKEKYNGKHNNLKGYIGIVIEPRTRMNEELYCIVDFGNEKITVSRNLLTPAI